MKSVASALADILDSPIAYHRSFVLLKVGVTGAVMLSQAMYWSKRTSDKHGWFYKSQEEWEEETGLTRYEQETARKKLVKTGIIEESRSGLPARLFYRVNKEVLISLLVAAIERNPSMRKSRNLDRGKAPDKSAGKQQPGVQESHGQDAGNPAIIHTEITTETTSETLSGGENPPPAASGLPVVLSGEQQPDQNEHKEPTYEKIRTVFWERFDNAYFQRYAATIPRNAKTNSQVKQLIARLGKEAPAVACFYVSNVNEQRVVLASHTLDFLLLNAEGYRTQWINGRSMTATHARQMDGTQANANVADEAIRILRERNAQGGGQ